MTRNSMTRNSQRTPPPFRIVVAAALVATVLAALPAAADWPRWRGPEATGASPTAEPPVRWSEGENVRFKVAIPGRGHASPIVHGDRLYLLTAVPADPAAAGESQEAAEEKRGWPPSVEPSRHRFVVLALSRDDGSVVWERTAVEKVPHETTHHDGTWASASPVTDGERLYAHFGSAGLYGYDLDGELLWKKDLGDMRTRHGFGEGASPAVHGDTLVVNWDHEGDSFLVALDARTGEERWRVERDEVTSWSTPIVVEHGGRTQVIVAATGASRGYDLETGEVIWSLGGMTVNTVPSPVHGDGMVYLTSGFRGNALQAVRLAAAEGKLDGTEAVAWSLDRDTPYVPSPLLYGGHLYFLKSNSGILTNADAGSGEIHYTERLDGVQNVYASPVAAAGRVYVVGRDGTTLVIRHGEKLEVLARNTLDDRFDASPALAGSDLYLRGYHHLYALAETGPGEGEESGEGEKEVAAEGAEGAAR